MATKRAASRKVRRIYEFIKANQHLHSIESMCRSLGVARSGYYEWLRTPVSLRAQDDARLLRLIRALFGASHGVYGAPSVFLDVREAGGTCSKHRVARLMRVNNIRARYGYRTRYSNTTKPPALTPNVLERNFNVSSPINFSRWLGADHTLCLLGIGAFINSLCAHCVTSLL